jgi:hypothetical protein
MKSKILTLAVRTSAVLVLAVATVALAQDPPRHLHLSGLINDYTPTTTVKPMGPWEMRGTWTLTLNHEFQKADFSAALTMEEGDYWLSQNTGDVDDPGARSQHTHHITMKGTVSYDTSVCVPPDSPPNTVRFVVTGMASATANGNNPPFAPDGETSQLVVCVAGGGDIEYSNVMLLFSKPASGHFGSQPIHGVVRKVSWRDDSHR